MKGALHKTAAAAAAGTLSTFACTLQLGTLLAAAGQPVALCAGFAQVSQAARVKSKIRMSTFDEVSRCALAQPQKRQWHVLCA